MRVKRGPNIHLTQRSSARGFDDAALSGVTLEQVRVVEAPGVTHLRFRVECGASTEASDASRVTAKRAARPAKTVIA